MAERKYKVGDFIRYRKTSHEKDTNTCVILTASPHKKNGLQYKLEYASGNITEGALEKDISPDADDQRQEWIEQRQNQLMDSEQIGKLLENHAEKGSKTTLGGLERLVLYIDLSPEQEKCVEKALKTAHQNKLIVWGGDKGPDKIPTVFEKSSKRQKPGSTKPETQQPKRDSESYVDLHDNDNRATNLAEPNDVPPIVSSQVSPTDEPNAADAEEVTEAASDLVKMPTEMELPSVAASSAPQQAPPPVEEPVQAEPMPKEIAEGLVGRWENSLPESDDARQELAEQMRQLLDSPFKPSDAAAVIVECFNLYETDPDMPHPLYWILSGNTSPVQRRQLIARLDLSTLERYVKWLVQRPSIPVAQVEGLLNGLSDPLSRAACPQPSDDIADRLQQGFQAATREGGIDHYQRIARTMCCLLEHIDAETRRPYEWRLFSFLRESWARVAPHAQEGSNDLIGARDFLKWIVESKKMWPETIWPTLLSSLMRDEALSHIDTDTRRSILVKAAEYALGSSEPGQRRMRLLHFQEALSEKTHIEFIIEAGKEAPKHA